MPAFLQHLLPILLGTLLLLPSVQSPFGQVEQVAEPLYDIT
jgi:hypothetical protein